ncbi:DUF202 domain-containing protein [Candidatus Synechococcus calcipolaris G9]|uniref:DUF202 domain-containing protein n=1 Tax=Candidatus Synechococcus calcipolaris G9 TaxID=1497997 RepID=A0ABT6EV65_9SYNE|nr:DUF202 domain-containing protein [Candidatus Synechococcus calcipolaris]MDG2989709.1 DUF202 domain-containing protein [Candidatus Synechococcus calcipolaris G9]
MTQPPKNPPKIDRQREHQANERTYLAWLRTSIALISFGFAIARFGIFVKQLQLSLAPQEPRIYTLATSENLGMALVVFGIFMIVAALWSYNQSFRQIEQGNYQPNRLMILITTIIVIILGSLSLTFMVRREPQPKGPPLLQQRASHFRNR